MPRALSKRGIPFAFVTGYDKNAIPGEFAHIACLEKPLDPDRAVAFAASLVRRKGSILETGSLVPLD